MTTCLPHKLAAVWLTVYALGAVRAVGDDAGPFPTTTATARSAALAALEDTRPPNPYTPARSSWLATQFGDPGTVPETLPYLGPLGEQSYPPLPDEAPMRWDIESPPQTTSPIAECCPADAACGGYGWQMMPRGLIYRTYLAGVKESRFRSVWNYERDDANIWDITLGGQVGLLRYGTQGAARPEGWQLGIEGAGLVRLDTDVNRDVNATDYRFGIPLSWGNATYQQKFAYYHLSSHVGDEFLLRTPGFTRVNYSRDVLVWGHSLYLTENFRVYGEAGYGVFVDVAEPWEFQAGVDWAPGGPTGARGAPFAAVNGHIREEVDFGGNFVVQSGWCWRGGPSTGIFRVGVEYYNGKDDQFSFFNESVEKTGVGIWYDY